MVIVARKLLLCAALAIHAVSASAQYAVTTNADSGPGSLRQGILDANSGVCPAPCQITYGSLPGVTTIEPLTPLPDITATKVSIHSEPPYRAWSLEISGRKVTSGSGLHFRCSNCGVSGVIINAFPGSGIVIEDGAFVSVSYCVIGLDSTGKHAVPNQQNGVAIVRGHDIYLSSNTIGGNVGNGVYAVGATNVGFGLNSIGKQYLPQGESLVPAPNGATGVFLLDVQQVQFLGDVIANNALDGVATFGISNGVKIEHRDLPVLIYGNGLLAIDLGFDGVTEQGRPVLTVADVSNGFARVIGDVRATPNTSVDLNIFASDALTPLRTADAKTALYAAKVNTDAAGFASFEFRFRPPIDVTGQWISATATTMAGTSELSAPLQAVANNQNYTVLNTEDSGAGSLRQAILDANAGICSADFPCRVQFDLPAPVPASGHYTIAPLTPLPAIRRSGIVVDGENTPLPFFGVMKPPLVEINGSRSTPGAGLTISSENGPLVNVAIRRLAINGFNGPGILIDASDNYILNPVISNNFIGTDPTGTIAVPNTEDGIRVRGDVPFVHIGTFSSGNRIQGNLISGNLGNGVMMESGFFEFQANAIGTDVTQKLPIPNGSAGVDVEATANSHLEGNTIAFNGTVGISTVITTPTAFKGAIQNSIHSNAGPAIELRDAAVALAGDVARQTPPEITSATYDPATGVTTIAGSFTRVTTSPDYWTTTLDFATSTFPESGGRGSMETPLYVNLMALKDEGQRRFSFSGTSRQVDLRGKRISATATPFIYEGFKAPPQNDIFGQGFVYGTTSEVSKAVPIVTLGCPADMPQITESSPGEFRWNTVAGATAYNVWLRTVPGVPHVIANTSGGSAAVSLEPGTYEWFVEAIFPQCPSTKSEAASITVKPGRKRVVSR